MPRESDHPMALKKAAPMLQTCTQWDLPSPQVHNASPRGPLPAGPAGRGQPRSPGLAWGEGISQWVSLASHTGWALSSGAVYLANCRIIFSVERQMAFFSSPAVAVNDPRQRQRSRQRRRRRTSKQPAEGGGQAHDGEEIRCELVVARSYSAEAVDAWKKFSTRCRLL